MEIVRNMKERWKNTSRNKRLVIGIICCLLVIAITITGIMFSKWKSTAAEAANPSEGNTAIENNTTDDESSQSNPFGDGNETTLPSDTPTTDPQEETTAPTEQDTEDGNSNENTEPTEHVHNWGSWKTVVKATTTSEGKEERTCSSCGAKESRKIDKLKDNGNSGTTTPTNPPETKPTNPPVNQNWHTDPGTRPYEYQEVFSDLAFPECGIYEHCDRYGNVWYDRSPSSSGYGKNIYKSSMYPSDLHYYGNGVWSNWGAYWSEDGSRQGGTFNTLMGAVEFSDLGSGSYVSPYGPNEPMTHYITSCGNMLAAYSMGYEGKDYTDEELAEIFAELCAGFGVSVEDAIGYRDNPTTHVFPGMN